MSSPATRGPERAAGAPARASLRPDIVEEHGDELDFLWCQRALHLAAHDWTLDDLAALEERAEAHRDGLRIWGATAVELARSRLASETTAEATVATFVLLDAGTDELAREVVAALRAAPPAAARAIGRALRHSDVARILPSLREIAVAAPAPAAAAVADALTFRRALAEVGNALPAAEDPDTTIDVLNARGRARAVGRPELDEALRRPQRAVRRAALEAAARSGTPELLARCREAASGTDAASADALWMLGCAGEARDVALLTSAASRAPLRVAALRALGACGRVEAVPWLLERAADPHAAAALRRILGAPGAVDAPDEATEEEPGARAAIAKAWERGSDRFDPSVRWQLGNPAAGGTRSPGFAEASLRVRRELWIGECALGGGDAGRFEPDELAGLQLRG